MRIQFRQNVNRWEAWLAEVAGKIEGKKLALFVQQTWSKTLKKVYYSSRTYGNKICTNLGKYFVKLAA